MNRLDRITHVNALPRRPQIHTIDSKYPSTIRLNSARRCSDVESDDIFMLVERKIDSSCHN